MNFLLRHRGRIFLVILAVLVLATLWGEASESVVKKDLDGNGVAEAEVHYGPGRRVEQMTVDANGDGKADQFFYYRKGRRDHAEKDTDFDGRTDAWLTYDPTGNLWKEALDLGSTGKANYWRYFKEGQIYRWDRDRNLDGKPDRRTVFTDGPGHQGPRASFLKRAYDDDFDGVFDRVIGKIKPPAPPPGSLAEARYRS